MKRDSYFGREGGFLVLPLHSGIPSKMQREVFKRPPPGASHSVWRMRTAHCVWRPSQHHRPSHRSTPWAVAGARKIVLATNIAETSITIDDVSFVVDSCRVKEKTYDPYLKMCTLSATWISKASARQRRGKTPRPYHALDRHCCRSLCAPSKGRGLTPSTLTPGHLPQGERAARRPAYASTCAPGGATRPSESSASRSC